MHLVQARLQFPARDVLAAQVEQHQVVVGAAGDEVEPAALQAVRQRRRVFHDVFGVYAEFRLHRLAQADGLGRDDVHERAALRAGEDGAVELLAILRAGEDHAAARAAQGLVRRRGHDVGIRHGTHVLAARHKARDVGHVHHKQSAAAVRDLGEDFKIDGAGIRRRARDQQLRAVFFDEVLDLVVIDAARGGIDAVADAVVVFAREVDLRAVGQVAAVGQVHTHERVARLQKRGVDLEIRLRAGVRLHVGEFRAEQRLGPLDGDGLQLVHIVAATVVALAGVALGVFICQNAAHGQNDGLGRDVLRSDQLDVLLLPAVLAAHGTGDVGVEALQIVHGVLQNVLHDGYPF